MALVERMDALGHGLPEDVQRRILSFEPHPAHPMAVLVKNLSVWYEYEEWAHGPIMTRYVLGYISGKRYATSLCIGRNYVAEKGYPVQIPDAMNYFGINITRYRYLPERIKCILARRAAGVNSESSASDNGEDDSESSVSDDDGESDIWYNGDM